MNSSKRIRISQLSMALAVALTAPVMAQNTSSAIGGRITSTDGKPVAGATVSIKHNQSGSVSSAVTDAEGRYSSRGLRVGGPYTVTITKDGVTETRDNVYLQLAETKSLDASLGQKVLDSVTVAGVAAGSEVFSADKMGAGTSVSREQIDSFASINRNLQDYARLDPRISQSDKERGEISVAGQNSRYNSITIDGVSTSDPFGLEGNNLPTAKQPISIDTIDSVQINISNYDVTQTGYTGANINAVTKSGTNEFSGTVSYVLRNDNMAGDRLNFTTGEYFDSPAFEEETKGFTLGGPILKDKLFFFVAYEEFTSSRVAPEFGPIDSDSGTIVGITQAQIDNTIALAQAKWGIDVGGQDIPSGTELKVKDSLVKLDWNINDNHRASLRYNKTEQSEPIFYGFGSRSLSLSSHWTTQSKVFESYVGQIFSDWTDNFSTELKVSQSTYDSIWNNGSTLPQIAVEFTGPVPSGVASGTRTLYLGTERSRQFNQLNTETLDTYLGANWYLGDHVLKFGFDYDDNKIFNAFLQNTNGNYTFSCLYTIDCANSFEAGVPRVYTAQQPRSGLVLADGAANWTLANLGFFLQDTWAVNNNLTITYGFRVDSPMIDEKPLYNAGVNLAPVYGVGPFGRQTGGFGYRNDVTIDGQSLFQPRFGFNYTFDSERPMQVRGGFGLFQGAAANVWLSNPYSNTGLATQVVACGGSAAACVGSIFSPDPTSQPSPIANQPAANVDLIDPDLKQPAVWKANLAFEHELPVWNMVFTTELIYTKVDTAIVYENLNLGEATRIGTDGREMYWDANGLNSTCWNATGSSTCSVRSRARSNLAYGNVLIARPTDKGEGSSFTIGVNRPMINDWSWSLAYVATESSELNALTSSTSSSQWSNNNTFNPNEQVLGNSNYLIKDRFIGTFAWKHNFFGDNATSFAVFYEGRKGKPYSYTYINDFNGDGLSGNDLLYIPTAQNSGEVLFKGGAADEQKFWDIVNAQGLDVYAGGVVDKNTSFAPWVNQFDVRISQEFPGFFEGNKAVIVLDIMNIGNLINKDWGHIDEIGFPSNRSFVFYTGIDQATGKYVYSTGNLENYSHRSGKGESSWSAQVTVRYEF